MILRLREQWRGCRQDDGRKCETGKRRNHCEISHKSTLEFAGILAPANRSLYQDKPVAPHVMAEDLSNCFTEPVRLPRSPFRW